MSTWETSTSVSAAPERVLGLLTDPDACMRWSPVRFKLRSLDGDRLRAGSRVELAGRIVGREVAFRVEVLRSDDRNLELRACGPFQIRARYQALPAGSRTELRASVSVCCSTGLRGRLVSAAAESLLAAGLLDGAVSRIACEAETAAA